MANGNATGGRIRTHVQCAYAGLLLVSTMSWAQNPGPNAQETITQLAQQVQQLQQQDRDLRERVKMLEARQQQASSTTTADPNPSAVPPQLAEKPPEAQAPSAAPFDWHDGRSMQWRGFAEVNYKVLDQRQPELGTYGFVPGSAGNFYTGDFDLFLSSKLNNKASVLSEIAFGETDHQAFNVDLERFLLQYEFNDHLKISFGRYQTGLSYYNSEFKSAKWFLTTADRPLITEFASDGGLLPTQAVGISITGLIPSGRLGLHYVVEYGSSDAVRPAIDGSGILDDENNGNHINVGFFVRPETIRGLQIGGSFYHDKIDNSSIQPIVRIGQTIVNAHVVYTAHGFEILNEGFLVRHAPENSRVIYNMPAFYSQVSRRFGRIRPFWRYQYANMGKGATVFDDVDLRYGPSFGARYDFDENIAFKVQLDHTARRNKPDLNGVQTQLVFTF